MPRFRNFCLIILLLFFNFHFTLNAQTKSNHVQHDWPQWRGPNRDGISREVGLLKTWPKDGPKVLWRVRTDSKYRNSWGNGPRVTPLVAGNLVYAISAHAKLYACDAKTGAVKWQHDLAKELNDAIPDLGYSNSPIVDVSLAHGRL